MNDTVSIPHEFQKLFAKNKKTPKRRNKQNRKLQIQHENELLQLLHSKWSILISGASFIQMDNQEIKSLTKQMYADSSSLLAYFHKNRLLIKIIEYGNNSLNWNVALPSPVYLMPNSKPLLNEYDFIELHTFRSLESKFEASLEMLDELSFDERAGQLLFSAIAYGALFVPWKQRALMNSVANQWVFESFASWVELKELKDSSKRKSTNELCDDDYQQARWFPDPLSELLIIRWLKDYPDTECFKGNRGIQSLLFAFLRKAGVPEDEMPPSLYAFTQWASHLLALELPPYMHSISFDKPVSTHISPESWLRMYSGMPVKKYDSSIPTEENHTSQRYSIDSCIGLIPLSRQSKYLKKIKSELVKKKNTRPAVVAFIQQQLNASDESPSFIAWLIATFVLNLLQNGGVEKRRLEISTVQRYLGAIESPLLNAFADVDASQLTESLWLSLLQDAIDQSKDQMSKNRIAEFAHFIKHFESVPDFDINELEGPAINKRVNANLVSCLEFDSALADIKYGGRLEKMQRLAGILGFYLGLRRGESIHILLRDIAGQAFPELLVRINRHHRTKNRTSRRLPLSVLLPKPLLNEFMLFYHERVEEEQGKLGNKLLFCFTGNPHSPLSGKELLDPIMDKLKAVTGDKTLIYHNLRHSFCNNTLLRLLLPEFPRLRCTGVAMFEHKHFSMKSCEQFRRNLLPGTDKDVRTSIRDTLYQLAMFMSHASPETTIKSYLHMFDWIIHRCLTENFIQQNDNQIKNILNQMTNYWSELKNRFSGGVKNGPIHTDELLLYARKKQIKLFPNPVKQKRLRKRRSSEVDPNRNITPADLIQLLPMLFNLGHTIEEAAERLNVSSDDIIRIKNNAQAVHQHKNMALVLPPLTAPHLHKDRNRILGKHIEIRKNDKYIQAGLRKIVQALPSPSLEVKHGSEKEVNTYIEFLLRLSIPKSRIILWYYPDRRSSESERESIQKWWSKETGIPVNRILQKSLSHARFSNSPEERIGWVSVFVREAKHESTNKSSGVQQALHLLTVFTYDRL